MIPRRSRLSDKRPTTMRLLTYILLCVTPALASPPDNLHADYAAGLSAHVNDTGLVDYAALKKNPAKLDAYLKALAGLNANTVAEWSEPDRLALYLNAYNAITLKSIANNYPIDAGFFASFVYPKNSIRQIDGVWDETKWTVAGKAMTLDHIEHEILRKGYNEPRIHMALVCAALGCPPLRNEPYTGDRLDKQLDDQSRRFLASASNFRIERDKKTVYVSSIFKWFGEDFVKTHSRDTPRGLGATERAIVGFTLRYVDEVDAKFLRAGGYELEYLSYDWSLNEQ